MQWIEKAQGLMKDRVRVALVFVAGGTYTTAQCLSVVFSVAKGDC